MVVKTDADRLSDSLSDGTNHVVLLKFAEQECRGEKVESALFCNQCG